MSSFQDKLKAHYQSQNKITPLIEGLMREIPQQTLDDYYVKLQTIIREDDEIRFANYETISARKQEIEVEALFDPLPKEETEVLFDPLPNEALFDPLSNDRAMDEAPINKLLILGGAGVGKSTLMQYLAYRWSKGELWNGKFDYVYRIPLKILLNRDWDRDYSREERNDLLKCLVHYHFISGVDFEERKNYELKDIPWLDKKEKILLLLDGFDEVVHTSTGSYKRLFEDIFRHKNLIFTSRPNAIDKDLAQKFEKKVENVGFDHDGINQYLAWYFKNDKKKGLALEEFLEKNSYIRHICKIPVNIAMICFIWSKEDSNHVLGKISNITDLYHKVVDQLGFRYYAKQLKSEEDHFELSSKWKSGKIYLDELRVLQYTAYRGMTGGGIEVPDDKRFEALTIKGMVGEEDQYDVSIQGSIDYLREEFDKEMPTINMVYKYGLLKLEDILAANQEPPETFLLSCSFSFVHLSFQEFLTARYFAEKLMKPKNNKEQENIATFIARHRNEPRYLMTLKFTAGILSSAKGEKAEQGIKTFWDAVMCNLDGVLEFGVETKASLLMHLLSQAIKEEKIDERIPNKNVALNLIDNVVLRDISGWSTQLKESDFLSQKIKKGLLEFLVKKNLGCLPEKNLELQKELNLQGNKNNARIFQASTEEIIDIIGIMITKFSEKEQGQIFLEIFQLLKEKPKTKWRSLKKAIELIIIIHHKAKFKIKADEQEVILGYLLESVYDSNLDEATSKAIQELIKKDQTFTFIERVKRFVKQELGSVEIEQQSSKMPTLLNIIEKNDLDDIQLVNDAIHVLTSLEDLDLKFLMSAPRDIGDLLDKAGDMKTDLAKKILKTCAQLLKNENFNVIQITEFSEFLEKLGNIAGHNDIELIRNIFDIFAQLLSDQTNGIGKTYCALRMVDFINSSCKGDIQLFQDALDILTPYLMDNDRKTRGEILKIFKRLIKENDHDRNQLFLKVIESQINLLEDSQDGHIRDAAVDTITELMKISNNNDLKLARNLLNVLDELSQDPDYAFRNIIPDRIIDLMKTFENNEVKFVQDAFNILVRLLQDWSEDVRISASEIIVDLIEIESENNCQLVKGVENDLIKLLDHSNGEVQNSASITILWLIEINENANIQLGRRVFETLAVLLKDTDQSIKELACKTLIDMTKMRVNCHTELMKDVIDTLEGLLKHPSWNSSKFVSEIIQIILDFKDNRNTQVVRDVISALLPLRTHFNSDLRKVAEDYIDKFLEDCGQSETQVINDVLRDLTPFLSNPQYQIKKSTSKTIIEVMKKSHPRNPEHLELETTVLNVLIPLLQNTNSMERRSVLDNIIELVQISGFDDSKLFRDALDKLTPFLINSSFQKNPAALQDILTLMSLSGKNDTQLAQHFLQKFTTFLKDSDLSLLKKNSVSEAIIGFMNISGQIQTQPVQDSLDIFIRGLEDENFYDKRPVSDNIINLIELKSNGDTRTLVKKVMTASIKLLDHEKQDVKEAAGLLLQRVLFNLLLTLEDFIQYFDHPSKDLRDLMVGSLFMNLESYNEKFELLNKLFQDQKFSLTLENIKERLFKTDQIPERIIKDVQIYLEQLQKKDEPSEDKSSLLSNFKSLFLSEFNQIHSLKGSQIIELAMLALSREKIPEDDLWHPKMIEAAKETLDIQIKYFTEEVLNWMNDNNKMLVSLSPEMKIFSRKVCHKILEGQQITPFKEELMIKFINQGLTNSLTRNGEIMFEGKRYKLQGNDIERAFEKFAKTILHQQQDILALQYRENKPIFIKSSHGGMKEAAVDKKEVKSIVDKRFKLKLDSWLFTILKSPKSESEILILERRTIFGDHFLSLLTNRKLFRFYPNEAPALNEIFGSYIFGEYYFGETKEVTIEVGQQLFESQDLSEASQIEGKVLPKQTYFQQELLGEGSEDRNQGIEEILKNKLDNNCAILEDDLEPLRLSEPQTLSIQAYCRGFVSAVSQRFISSQMKADGSFVIDDGRACFNTVNLFFQLSGRDSSGVGYVIAETIDSVRSYFKTAPIINEAHLVKDIAIDVVELSDLAWKTALEIIKDEKNRQRIFDAKDVEQATCWKKVKNCLACLCPCQKVPNKIKGQIIKEWCQKLQNKIKQCKNKEWCPKLKNCIREWKNKDCWEKLQNCIKKGKDRWKYHKLPQMLRDERDYQRGPAYHLGVDDAHKIIEAWIGLNDSSPHLQMNQKEKIKKFAEEAVADPERKKDCCSCSCFCSGVCSCFHWVWDKIC